MCSERWHIIKAPIPFTRQQFKKGDYSHAIIP